MAGEKMKKKKESSVIQQGYVRAKKEKSDKEARTRNRFPGEDSHMGPCRQGAKKDD